MNADKLSPGEAANRTERVYVRVTSDFDPTGYMQPRSITWADGRTFPIDAVKEYRPAAVYRRGAEGACFTVMIRGAERRLFFEWTHSEYTGRVARWYVETAAETV